MKSKEELEKMVEFVRSNLKSYKCWCEYPDEERSTFIRDPDYKIHKWPIKFCFVCGMKLVKK